jgi:two-component system, LytTR family, sensor histidine kinase AlgZ
VGVSPSLQDLPDRFAKGLLPIAVFGVLLYLLAAALHTVLWAFEASREAERRRMEAQVLAREAELKALRAQLDPHFLFNALNSVSALVTTDPKRAREMCAHVGEFLRGALGLADRAGHPLAEELRLLRAFLTIERVRFGDRLSLTEEVDPSAVTCVVPPLLLQPLVENAVKHGISTVLHGGTIVLDARRDGDTLRIALTNPFESEGEERGGAGLGLANVRRRLEARWGTKASLSERREGGRFHVELAVPAEEAT